MNESPKKWKLILIGLMAGVLLGGTVAVTAPSVAAGSAKVWKQIKKKADKRYYTKAKSDARYYTKAASDSKYSPKTTVLRGAIALGSAPTSGYVMTPIVFGITLDSAPLGHIIPNGSPVPLGCSGTPASPSASPGHLCIFEQATSGLNTRFLCSAVNICGGPVSKFGAFYGATTTGNAGFAYGSWALGVGSFTSAKLATPRVLGTRGGPPGGK